MPTLEEVRRKYAADRFATETVGCTIERSEPGHAVCALPLGPGHRNALGMVQGGAVFTLADFAFAVASNAWAGRVSVSLQHDITYLRASRGTRLFAEARSVRDGRRMTFYQIDVTDDTGALIAVMTCNGCVIDDLPQKTEE